MTLQESARTALEALGNCASEHGHRCNRCDSEVDEGGKVAAALRAALYAHPEPAQAKPLTDEQIMICFDEAVADYVDVSDAEMIDFARAIERAHGIT